MEDKKASQNRKASGAKQINERNTVQEFNLSK